MIKDILYYPLVQLEDFSLAPVNLVVFILLFLGGKIILRYVKRLFRSQDLTDKRFTVEGKEFPVWKLTKQLIWLGVVFIGFWTLNINNPDLKSSHILTYEFFRLKEFHIAVYHIFVVIFIIFFSRILISLIRIYLLRRTKKNERADEGSMYVYLQLTKYLIIGLAIIFMLRSMGVDLGLFLTSMAFLLVGVSLGLQEIFRDYFSGFLLLFENTVKIGDIVEIDRPKGENFIAKIIDINLRTSKVETRDGKVLIVPNSQLSLHNVNNWTTGKTETRFTIPVAVSYDSDLDIVKQVLKEAVLDHPKVIQYKDVVVRLLNFGDHGYELDVVFWADNTFFIEIHKSEIRFSIDKGFKKHGISYPYPQMDVHFDKDHETARTSSSQDSNS